MVTSTPSLDYYLQVAQKAGLPVGDPKQMRKADPLARFAVGDVVHGSDTTGAQLSDERTAKVQKLADMDRKLHAMYTDPNSKFYSNNPFLLEGALNSETNVVSQDVAGVDKRIAANEQSKEKDIADISKFYGDLITSIARQKSGEAEAFNPDALIDEALGGGDSSLTEEEEAAINDLLEGF